MKKTANRIINSGENRLISEVLDEMVLSLKVSNRSEDTLDFYRENVGRFHWWLHEMGYPEAIDDITTSHVRLFIQYLQTNRHRWASRDNHESNKPLSEATVQAYFRALRAFFAFAERENFVEVSPFTDRRLSTPKVRAKIAPHYTDAEVLALLDACKKDQWDRLRDYAMILLLLDTGIRAEELCGLRLDGLESGRVKVLGKGNKERYLPLSPSVEKAIRDYRRKERMAGGEHLFVGMGTSPLSYDGLKSMLRRRGKVAGVQRATLHAFRRTFAIRFLEAGGALNVLEAILGHSSAIMSMRYAKMASLEAQGQHRKFSPIEALLNSTPRRGKR